jgi:hypothetical protein
VKCRNTDDEAEMEMTPLQMCEAEKSWFANHPEFKGCQLAGIPTLAARLDEIQRDLLLSTDVVAKLIQEVLSL